MRDVPTCPACGEPLAGERCEKCAEDAGLQWQLRFVHREMLLLTVLIVVALAAFGLTRLAAQKSRDLHLRDAATWHQHALDELDAGRTQQAIEAFRRAVVTHPDNAEYQLDLARALSADGQHGRARQVLLRLRDRRPEDADVNLQLARLEARGPDAAAAVRYYDHALAALWSDEHADSRQHVRMEMIDFLLRHEQGRRALAELLVLIPTLKDDDTRNRVGRMFLAAGDARRALDQFSQVLRESPENAAALTGAGEAAFALGDYTRARAFLAKAPEASGRVGELRAIAEFVLTRDPLAPRLGTAERRRRLAANLGDIAGRLGPCVDLLSGRPEADGETLRAFRDELEAFRERLTPRVPTDVRDLAEDGLELIVRIENAMSGVCGAPTALDEALLLIGRRHDIGTR